MKARLLLLALGLVPALSARAVILYGTGDPLANTTAPTGALTASGWQYEGQFNGFLGTAIAPNYFITAAHIGGAVGASFDYEGTSFQTIGVFPVPDSDLRIFQVSGTFSSYAPLYTNAGGEVGQDLVVIGRGTQRGVSITLPNSTPGGWAWGTGDGVERWGTNTVSQIIAVPGLGSLLNATFDASAGANEAALSTGDSGGAVFVHDTDGIWKLAGINYAVDGPFYTSNTGAGGPFLASMFDTTGLYEFNGTNYVPATNPSGFYASEIASADNLDFIYSVIPEPSSWMVPLAGAAALVMGRRRRA